MGAKSPWLFMGLLAFVVGLAGGALATNQLLKVPLHLLSLTTPVFVMDRARLIRALPPNATPEQMAPTVDGWKHLAAKLSAASNLVMDATAVVYVRTDAEL